MAFIIPKTFTTGEVLTHTDLNTYLRDNLNATALGLAAANGDMFFGSAANALSKVSKGNISQVFSAGSLGTGGGWTTYTYRTDTQVLSGTAASLSVSPLWGSQVRILAFLRTTSANNTDGLNIQFNSDSGAVYDYLSWYINNNAVTVNADQVNQNQVVVPHIVGGAGVANSFSALLIDIDFRSSNIYTVVDVTCFTKYNTSALGQMYLDSVHGCFRDAPATSIQLSPTSGSFAIGCSMQTYVET